MSRGWIRRSKACIIQVMVERWTGLGRSASSQLAAALCVLVVGGCGSSDSGVDVPEAGTCESGKTQCGGLCVDLDKNPGYCGGCGIACDSGQVCSRGACVVACQSELTNCNGSCVNLTADRESCGACGHACAQGQVCSAGSCALTCQKGLERCGDLCVDRLVDRDHCGTCTVACASGQLCSNGSCGLSCQKELTNCGGLCVNLLTSLNHCGSCAVQCGSGQVCSNGSCALTCQQGLTECYGICVDLQKDNGHCGGCDGLCQSGTLCSAGTCAVSCQAGLTQCSGTCANLENDGLNCGACAKACEAGKVCSEGSCVLSCPSGMTDCSGVCVNLTTDLFHCGACAQPCPAGHVCADSACVVSCEPSHTLCTPDAGAPYCANTKTDNDNCGGCGNVCASGTACSAGTCAKTCGSGLLLCAGWGGFDAGVGPGEGDASDEDAAEAAPSPPMTCVDPTTDDRNCGACGNLCGGEQSCVSGVCQYAGSCFQLLQRKGPLPDGTYSIDPDGAGPLKPFAVYCHNMSQGTPAEYLTFAHSAATDEPGSNYVRLGGAGACGCPDADREFTRVRLDISTLTIDNLDLTFSFLRDPSVASCWKQTSGSCGGSWSTSPYAIAYDCVSGGSDTGQANVDLRDTPFSLDPSVVWTYTGAGPYGTSSINPERTVANVTGGGYCGSNHPTALILKQN